MKLLVWRRTRKKTEAGLMKGLLLFWHMALLQDENSLRVNGHFHNLALMTG